MRKRGPSMSRARRCLEPTSDRFFCKQMGSEMRVFVASLIVLLVLYFWDRDYNNGNLVDGLDSMRRAISHSMFP